MNAQDYFDKSNDSTFNVVIYYRRYNDDKYFVVIKNGGLATAQTISRPKYKVVTNINDNQTVTTYDSLRDALESIDNHDGLKQLPDESQQYIKPVLKRLIGKHAYFTKYVANQIVEQIKASCHELINGDDRDQVNLAKCLQSFDRYKGDLTDYHQYSQYVDSFDRIGGLVRKIARKRNDYSTVSAINAINLYNAFLPR